MGGFINLTASSTFAPLSSPILLGVWGSVVAASLAVTARDLIRSNAQLPRLMKIVWMLTVLYSGPLGLAIYFWSGRRQIGGDSLWRRGFRSVAHCYSGCGAGEIIGVFITAGLLGLGNLWVTPVTFALAYVFGYTLTAGPLIQDGVPVRRALWDALTSESASITAMELTSLGVNAWLGTGAHIHHVRFWTSLVISLSAGLVAAYPVNLLLIRFGVKEGMGSPAAAGDHT